MSEVLVRMFDRCILVTESRRREQEVAAAIAEIDNIIQEWRIFIAQGGWGARRKKKIIFGSTPFSRQFPGNFKAISRQFHGRLTDD